MSNIIQLTMVCIMSMFVKFILESWAGQKIIRSPPSFYITNAVGMSQLRQSTLEEYFLHGYPATWQCLFPDEETGRIEEPRTDQWNNHLFECINANPFTFRRVWYGDAQCVCGCIDYPQFVEFEMRYPGE